MSDRDDGSTQPVEETIFPKIEGFAFHGTTKLVQNTKGINVECRTAIWYDPPPGEHPRVSMDRYEQALDEASRRTWEVAERRQHAAMMPREGRGVVEKDYDHDHGFRA